MVFFSFIKKKATWAWDHPVKMLGIAIAAGLATAAAVFALPAVATMATIATVSTLVAGTVMVGGTHIGEKLSQNSQLKVANANLQDENIQLKMNLNTEIAKTTTLKLTAINNAIKCNDNSQEIAKLQQEILDLKAAKATKPSTPVELVVAPVKQPTPVEPTSPLTKIGQFKQNDGLRQRQVRNTEPDSTEIKHAGLG